MRGMARPRRAFMIAVLLLALARAASADRVDGLYQGTAIVTGQENLEERARGLSEALARVLIKASGDARVGEDAARAGMLARAGDYAVSYAYQDRLAGKKLMDEQGTRERSYLLTVDFDPAKVDAALAALGRRPWGPERPRVLALFGIRDTVGAYVLGTESARGYGQRETLVAWAAKRGVPLVLPRMDEAERARLSFADLAAGESVPLARLKEEWRAPALLAGTMTLGTDGLWTTTVRLDHAGTTTRWSEPPASFDRAFAAIVDRAALILSGGAPPAPPAR